MFGPKIISDKGTEVEILEPGTHNRDAGPDFSAAVIRVGDMEWAGNVEIHVKASDWERHGHHHDKAYDSVILHVVGVDDMTARRTDGSEILQASVAPPASFFDRYAALIENSGDSQACLEMIHMIPRLNITDWLSTLGIERIQEKASHMKSLLQLSHGDWQQAIFIMMARALGFGLNGLPFELLAKSISLNFIMRHKDNPLQVEAFVFGQAGFLTPGLYEHDEYYSSLVREYDFLRKKYNLTPIETHLWKFSRTRPLNSPQRRLAILSKLLLEGMQFYDVILDSKGDYDTLMERLDVAASPYWHFHTKLGDQASEDPIPARLSKESREIILINVMAPFYYAYGSATGDADMAEKGTDLLNEIKPEKNFITSMWARKGIKADNAFYSQALIQLRRNYCERSRCLECRFGHYLLKTCMHLRHS